MLRTLRVAGEAGTCSFAATGGRTVLGATPARGTAGRAATLLSRGAGLPCLSACIRRAASSAATSWCCRSTRSRGAHALITTPAATKFYRAGPHPARAPDAADSTCSDADFEWLPQETIVFDGARAAARTRRRAARAARASSAGKSFCLGRPAVRRDLHDRRACIRISCVWKDDGRCCFDRLRLEGGSQALDAGWGLAGATAFGTLLAVLPARRTISPHCAQVATPGVRAALTLVDGVLHCRALGAAGRSPASAFHDAVDLQLRPALLRSRGGAAAHLGNLRPLTRWN